MQSNDFLGQSSLSTNSFGLNLNEIANQAIKFAQTDLQRFASAPDLMQKLEIPYGTNFDRNIASQLFQAIASGDFSVFPLIQILSADVLKGANGAFAAETGTIYLNGGFVAANAGNIDVITGVVREEYGHAISNLVNVIDPPWDEGEVLAGLLQGKSLDELEAIKQQAEDDTTTIVLNGKPILIEQATRRSSDFNGDGKDDFIRQEKGNWANDQFNTARVSFSNGNGTFRLVDIPNATDLNGNYTNLVVGDFNGDGKDDFIRQEKGNWANDQFNTARVSFSNGDGTFRLVDIPNATDLNGNYTNLVTSTPPNVVPDINIRLGFFGNFTQTQKDLINKAAQNWESIITGDMVLSGTLNIAVTQGSLSLTDKPWGAWAETDFPYLVGTIATPGVRVNGSYPSYDNQGGFDYDTRMHFNSNQLPNLSSNQLVRLATHEIGHALYLDEAKNDSLLGDDSIMDHVNLDPNITGGVYQRLEYLGYGVNRNPSLSWS